MIKIKEYVKVKKNRASRINKKGEAYASPSIKQKDLVGAFYSLMFIIVFN